MSKPALPAYRTTNWRACNAALKQRGSLLIRFDPETEWLALPRCHRGARRTGQDRHCPRYPKPRPHYLEALEGLSPTTPG